MLVRMMRQNAGAGKERGKEGRRRQDAPLLAGDNLPKNLLSCTFACANVHDEFSICDIGPGDAHGGGPGIGEEPEWRRGSGGSEGVSAGCERADETGCAAAGAWETTETARGEVAAL